jgi:hypothetical protein
MKKVSKIAAIASVAVASFLPMASAYATDNCVGSSDGCKPPIPQGSNEEGGVLPSEQEQPVATTSTEAPSGELPFTGGDVAGLAIIGAGALGLGAVMVRKSKAAKSDA